MSLLEMKVPSPGESISEVEIAAWLVSEGDYVEKDQAIAEVDSDKATLELPAEESGTIQFKAEEGDVDKEYLDALQDEFITIVKLFNHLIPEEE